MFSLGLDFVPNFIARSSVVFYREIKWTTRPEINWEANCTSLSASLEHFGLKLSWLCIQTSRSGFRWPFGKLDKFKAIVIFHDSEILQSHSVMFLHAFHGDQIVV